MDETATLEPASLDNIQPLVTRIRQNYQRFDGWFPAYGDSQTAYRLTANKNWLAAFWSGLLWLVAYRSGQSADIANAQSLLPSFAARLDERVHLNHDLGFLFTLSARASWQITGNADAHALALRAADELLSRFQPVGNYIQAWGELDDPQESGRFIIDCMMNLPLLFWATRETSEPRYREAAIRHAEASRQYLLRPDGSTYHTYFLDTATGAPVGPKTHQGYADESVWARGQGWAIYGFTMTAEWTDDERFVSAAKAAADWYLHATAPGKLSPWDFSLPADAPYVPDSSADAIAAGGLLRLARLTGEEHYHAAAHNRLLLLLQTALDVRPQAQGLFLHGTQHMPQGYGVDTYTIFGDYFAFEAMLMLLGQAPDFWGPQAK